MSIYDLISMLGGLGLFIYGMQMLGDGLEKTAGDRLKYIIEKLTTNKVMGLVVGCLVTFIIQSSSATTVMVVGFVNAGLMNLSQAVGVVLGANVGTTITAQLIAFKLTKVAPIFAFVGLILMLNKSKKNKKYDWGYVLFGFAVLFIGMNIMGDAMKPLGNSEVFKNMMTSFENPILGIIIGLIVTSIIQSSSVSIGLLQTLALAGLVTMRNSIFLVMGMNIGTCVTALIASFGCDTNAKRVAVIHFMQKVMTTIIFLLLMLFIPFVTMVEGWTPGDVTRQIANIHTVFNIVGVLFLLPISSFTIKLSKILVPDKEAAEDPRRKFKYIDKNMLSTPVIAQSQLIKEVDRLGRMALENMKLAEQVFVNSQFDIVDEVMENEEIIDHITNKITNYMMDLQAKADMSHEEEVKMGLMYHVIIDIERIGDYAENVVEYAEDAKKRQIEFSQDANEEIKNIFANVEKTVELGLDAFLSGSVEMAEQTTKSEERVDILIEKATDGHIQRMADHLCGPAKGVVFTNLLNDLERVSDHAQNIAYCVSPKTAKNEKAAGFMVGEA